MDNENDHNIIDWILQLDSAEGLQTDVPLFTNTGTLTAQPQTLSSAVPTAPFTEDAGKSDLFQLHLVDREDKAYQRQQVSKRSAMDGEHIDNTDKRTAASFTKRTKKAKSHGAEPLSGRLDFRLTMTDQVPESQLKAMSPRERRQLRNKISARNFRNRRKEYMSTLEEELDEYKLENRKLQTELTTIRNKMSKLEEENKQLRLDLVLYEEGIHPLAKQNNLELLTNNNSNNMASPATQHPNSSSSFELSPGTVHAFTSDSSSASPPDLNMLHDFPYNSSSLLQTQPAVSAQPLTQSSGQQQHQQMSFWTMPLPEFNVNDMYLAHALIPDWNVADILSKSTEQTSLPTNHANVMDTFRRFPLLAPALMSIVVSHTMTLSTDDILRLNFPTTNNSRYANGLEDKHALKIWDLLQQSAKQQYTKMITQECEVDDDQDKAETDSYLTSDDETIDASASYDQNRCVITSFVNSQVAVFHRYLKTYICASVHNCLLQCRIQSEEQKLAEQAKMTEEGDHDDNTAGQAPSYSPICEQFRRAKEMFISVS